MYLTQKKAVMRNRGGKGIQKTSSQMANINPNVLIITLNVNGLNIPIKRQMLSDWVKKQYPARFYLQKTHLRFKHTNRLEVKGWRKINHAVNINLPCHPAIPLQRIFPGTVKAYAHTKPWT